MADSFDTTPSEPKLVKCAECGYLALRGQAHELLEAPDNYRINGSTHRGGAAETVFSSQVPVCVAQVVNFAGELAGSDSATARQRYIGTPRRCGSFTKWRPGFSPKEHQQLQDREAADREARDWRERQAMQDHDWRQQDAADAERRHRESMRIAVWGVVIAFLVGVAAAWATLQAAK